MTLARARTLAPSALHNILPQSTSKFLLLHTGPNMIVLVFIVIHGLLQIINTLSSRALETSRVSSLVLLLPFNPHLGCLPCQDLSLCHINAVRVVSC